MESSTSPSYICYHEQDSRCRDRLRSVLWLLSSESVLTKTINQQHPSYTFLLPLPPPSNEGEI
jgi:hypothetical protein